VSYDDQTGRWSGALTISPAASEAVSFRLESRAPSEAPRLSSIWSVPIIAARDPIPMTITEAEPIGRFFLPWGSGPGQVGYYAPSDEGASLQPTALSVDPRNGDLVVLDAVNHRLVVVSPDSTTTEIPLPTNDRQSLNDVTVNGLLGTATVATLKPSDGTTTAYFVNLDTGGVHEIGPVPVPALTPTNTPTIWNDATQTVFARVTNDYYPYLDVTYGRLRVDEPPQHWFDTRLGPSGRHLIFLESEAGTITIDTGQLPSAITGVQVDNGAVWLGYEAIEEGSNTIETLVVRFDPTTATAVAVPIQWHGLASYTKNFVMDDGDPIVMRAAGDGGLTIERLRLPT
jgi:hypothetical protein